MNGIKNILMFAVALLLTFTACQKEEIIDTTDNTPPDHSVVTTNPLVNHIAAIAGGDEGLYLGCFSIDFTFEISINGEVTTISSEEDFFNVLVSTPDSFYIDFVYPLGITYEDGTTDQVDTQDELGEAFASCIPDSGWVDPGFPAYIINLENSCYNLVYPLTVTNGSDNFTLNSEEEFVDLFATEDFLSFVFPLNITDETGQSVIANSEEELMNLLGDCCTYPGPVDTTYTGSGYGMIACYDIVFPLNYISADGSVQTATNEDEMVNAIFNNDFLDFSYPMTLQEEGESPIVINNEAELNIAFEDCNDFNPGGGLDNDLGLLFFFSMPMDTFPSSCYTIVYPLSVAYGDGSVVSLADENDVQNELENDEDTILEYPVDVINNNGTTIVLNNIEDLFTVLNDCQ